MFEGQISNSFNYLNSKDKISNTGRQMFMENRRPWTIGRLSGKNTLI